MVVPTQPISPLFQPPATVQPEPIPAEIVEASPAAGDPANESDSQESIFGEMLRDQPPELNKPEELPLPPGDSPSDREPFKSPFRPEDDTVDDLLPYRDQADEGREKNAENLFGEGEDSMKSLSGITCAEFRERIKQDTIRNVSLDISPPYRPDLLREDDYQKAKSKFDEKQVNREWRSLDGTVIAKGRFRDLAYEKVIIDTELGISEQLPIERLSENDLAYISENWGLPMECRIPKVDFKPRQWASLSMTWHASNLCHKPLYFEDVNLERYGHTHGPLVEPIVSSAHFFANIAVLPYKMGVHSPHECQYALGYYRPGNCAPWIKQPVPLSVRGALYQGAYMTGMFWLIP